MGRSKFKYFYLVLSSLLTLCPSQTLFWINSRELWCYQLLSINSAKEETILKLKTRWYIFERFGPLLKCCSSVYPACSVDLAYDLFGIRQSLSKLHQSLSLYIKYKLNGTKVKHLDERIVGQQLSRLSNLPKGETYIATVCCHEDISMGFSSPMPHIIWLMWYGSYHMSHMIWLRADIVWETQLSKTNFPSKKAANIIHQLTNHRADANAYKTIKKGFTASKAYLLPLLSCRLCH